MTRRHLTWLACTLLCLAACVDGPWPDTITESVTWLDHEQTSGADTDTDASGGTTTHAPPTTGTTADTDTSGGTTDAPPTTGTPDDTDTSGSGTTDAPTTDADAPASAPRSPSP